MRFSEVIKINQDDFLWNACVNTSSTTSFSGLVDINYFLLKGDTYCGKSISPVDFFGSVEIGENSYIESSVFIGGGTRLISVKIGNGSPGLIKIGKNVVMRGTNILSYSSVIIEDDVYIESNVTLMDCAVTPPTFYENDFLRLIRPRNILIKKSSRIGANSMILDGVTVGCGAVVGVGAVVQEDVPDYAIVAGNPAKVINYIE
jgi:UDP-2-acetamido-3-amino-2,3-dideoxy-glucuronate N-acetyltransferase